MNNLFTVALIITFLSACTSTHLSKVEYEGRGVAGASEPQISQVIVSDNRGTDADWLGAIRGGYGNRLKTLRTEQSTDVIVDKMYTRALEKSGLYLANADLPVLLKVSITKFDCSYFFNREAHAHVEIALGHVFAPQDLFSKAYRTDLTEAGVGAGIFGDVDTLRDLCEEAMNQTIDKMLNDDEFREAVTRVYSFKSETGLSDVEVRLRRIKDLYESGTITVEEYQEKRRSILSEL